MMVISPTYVSLPLRLVSVDDENHNEDTTQTGTVSTYSDFYT